MEKIATLEFSTMEGNTPFMTINGIPMHKKVMIEVITCGNCKNILAQFQPNQPIQSRMEYINSSLKNEIIYCPKCGSKINYGGCEIIEEKASEEPEK